MWKNIFEKIRDCQHLNTISTRVDAGSSEMVIEGERDDFESAFSGFFRVCLLKVTDRENIPAADFSSRSVVFTRGRSFRQFQVTLGDPCHPIKLQIEIALTDGAGPISLNNVKFCLFNM